MNTKIEMTAQAKNSVLVALGNRYSVEPGKLLETMRQTLARNASNEELIAFSIVANQYKLNPFVKEIYAFPAKGGGIVPMVSVDGWLRLINTHSQFDGLVVEMSPDGSACTVTIYRKDTAHPTVITEYLEECARPTEPWKKCPRRMLRHKAIIQAGRVAFGFGGIYDEDEGRDVAGATRPVAAKVVPGEPINPFADVPKPEVLPTPEPDDELVRISYKLERSEGDGEKDMDACGREFWGGDDSLPGLDVPPADYEPTNREDY